MSKPRVAVVDDGALTRSGFQAGFPELDVIATYATVDELVAERPEVDLVVLDLLLSTSLQGEGVIQGPPAIRVLVGLGYRICLYTDERRPLVLAHCLAAGASGLARKCDGLAVTQSAFLQVARGEAAVARSLVGLAEVLSRHGQLPSLTIRQTEVLAARARGEKWESLARRLNISVATANDHLDNVMMKMVFFLHHLGVDPHLSPADVERALGLTPGDLMDPESRAR
jgi:DNA-binding NarL/FixJ family response regulator